MFAVKAQKIGNSTMVTIPRKMVKKLGIRVGESLDLEEMADKIIYIKRTSSNTLYQKALSKAVKLPNKLTKKDHLDFLKSSKNYQYEKHNLS